MKRYPILVVDDEQDNLDAFRFNFRKTFDVLTASGGGEALQILEDKEVAVVVTDQRMPRMTGVELLQALVDDFSIEIGDATVRLPVARSV